MWSPQDNLGYHPQTFCPSPFWDRVSHWSLPTRADCLARKHQGYDCPCLLSNRAANTPPYPVIFTHISGTGLGSLCLPSECSSNWAIPPLRPSCGVLKLAYEIKISCSLNYFEHPSYYPTKHWQKKYSARPTVTLAPEMAATWLSISCNGWLEF